EQKRYDGKWVVQTNDDTIEVDDAACGYKNLMTIEGCFRSLKSVQIQLQPMYHRLPERIEAHIRICVSALLIERIVEIKTGETWQSLLTILKTLQATRYEAEKHGFFRLNDISPDLKSLLKNLKVSLPKQVIEVFPIKK
ncbi:MAG: transposase, partial [Deltaproteobacteria bacterium]|nr:transposase [Deltaproteobacteria bacterium]